MKYEIELNKEQVMRLLWALNDAKTLSKNDPDTTTEDDAWYSKRLTELENILQKAMDDKSVLDLDEVAS